MKAGKGKCFYCNGVFTKGGMIRHLATCPARMELYGGSLGQQTNNEYFWLNVSGAYRPQYWMYLQVSTEATLYDLDDFLREIWLECCGHLSLFDIDGTEYLSNPEYVSDFDDEPESYMDVELQEVLREGMNFIYQYDFGSTTTLKLKVVGLHDGAIGEEIIEIMAQNLAPVINCSYCGGVAKKVCCGCSDGWLCGKCAKEHPCGD